MLIELILSAQLTIRIGEITSKEIVRNEGACEGNLGKFVRGYSSNSHKSQRV
jgi:hypothetical protein